MAVFSKLMPLAEPPPGPVYFKSADLSAGSVYPTHRHSVGQFVHSHCGVIEVGVESGQLIATPQFGIWLPPGVEHLSQNRDAASFSSLYLSRAWCAGLPETACALTVSPLIAGVIDELRARRIAAPQDDEERRLVRVLVDALVRAPRHGSYLPTSNDPALSAVLCELLENPGDNRSLSAWAEAVHSTERTLERRCRRDLGMGFGEWRQRLRVVRALTLLAAGGKVEAIAFELGYSSASAFIAMFRRQTGTSPDEFRKANPSARA
ncbi:AraC family transcriptional regulator [Crenobacter cavernae]|uniref:AraC family transcriptional regulator n=1 Tax=Crenobacter cavernae TaxID=2290923 RepID=A0ABY0FC64_9NEIS|nr:helix-turn-helix transcriptional regulator [Crenobacter cavernae]RXZ43683.1 AraC family transcriptional regulator [Crenobacter cavernae]